MPLWLIAAHKEPRLWWSSINTIFYIHVSVFIVFHAMNYFENKEIMKIIKIMKIMKVMVGSL